MCKICHFKMEKFNAGFQRDYKTRKVNFTPLKDFVMFWLWKIYVHILIGLCQLGITKVAVGPPSPDSWPGCWPFDVEPWASRINLL